MAFSDDSVVWARGNNGENSSFGNIIATGGSGGYAASGDDGNEVEGGKRRKSKWKKGKRKS